MAEESRLKLHAEDRGQSSIQANLSKSRRPPKIIRHRCRKLGHQKRQCRVLIHVPITSRHDFADDISARNKPYQSDLTRRSSSASYRGASSTSPKCYSSISSRDAVLAPPVLEMSRPSVPALPVRIVTEVDLLCNPDVNLNETATAR